MPRRDDAAGRSPPPPRRRPRPVERRDRESSAGRQLLIGLAAFGLVVAGCGGIGLYLAFGRKAKPGPAAVDPPVGAAAAIAPAEAPEAELPAGTVVALPGDLPAPAAIPDDPFGERKQKFMTEWPRVERPAAAWGVEPDRLDLKQPYAALAPAAGFTPSRIPEARYNGFAFPTTPSPFVAVLPQLGAGPQTVAIHDLRTGEQVGSVTIDTLSPSPDDVRLSPDGKALAVRKVNQCLVYAVAGGPPKQVPVSAAGWFDFGRDADHLISTATGTGPRGVVRTDLRTGVQTDLFREPPGKSLRDSYALSPNRKFLALVAGDRIVMVDTATGAEVGSRPGPALSFDKAPDCRAMAFSADGTRWAGVFGGVKGGVVVLDAATGQVTAQFPLPAGVPPVVSRQPVRLTPDGRALMVAGQFLIDATSGALVRDLGKPRPFGPGREETRVEIGADWTAAELSREGGERALRVTAFDRAGLAAELGVQAAAAPIPARVADRKGVREVTPVGKPEWRVPPSARLPRMEPPALPAGGTVRALALHGPARLLAALRDSAPGGAPQARELRIDLLDLAGDKPPQSVPAGVQRPDAALPARPAFDVAPRFAALVDLAAAGRVVVVPRDGGGPFAFQPADDGPVEWLAFAANEILLTVTRDGRLTAWRLPEVRAVWEARTASRSAAISPDRKVVVAFFGTRFDLLDAATGDDLGAVGVSDRAGGAFGAGSAAAAFRADGAGLVAAFPAGGSRAIGRWDLRTGKPVGEPVVLDGRAAGRVQAHGSRYAVIGDCEVFDLDHKLPICRYAYTPDRRPAVADVPPDDRLWHVPAGRGRAQAITLPTGLGAEVARGLEDGTLAPVLARGEAVAIEVRVDGATVRNAQQVPATLLAGVSERLQARGHATDPAAPNKVIVTATEAATGEEVEVRKIGQFDIPLSFPDKKIALRRVDVRVRVEGRRASHESKHTVKNTIQSGRRFPPGADVETTLKEELWAEAAAWAASAADVGHLFQLAGGQPVALPVPMVEFDSGD